MTAGYEPKWQLNNNGNDSQTIRDNYVDLHRAAMVLTDALHAVKVSSLHGRNYQTLAYAESCREADLKHIDDLIEMSKGVEMHAVAGAARIIKQREGI